MLDLIGEASLQEVRKEYWRDVFRYAIRLYYRLFYFLEDSCLLNPVVPEHIYSLHYVYLPRINKTLNDFCDGWNFHGVRTENNKTPIQLFTLCNCKTQVLLQ